MAIAALQFGQVGVLKSITLVPVAAGFSMTARVDPRTNARPGDKVKFAIDTEKIHIFDKDTEKTVTN